MFTNIARHGPSLLFEFVRPCPCICLDVVRPCPCASTSIDPAHSCASTSSHPAHLCASTPPVAARPCALPSTRPGVSLTTRQLRETGDFWQHGQRSFYGSTKTSGRRDVLFMVELLSHLQTRTVLWSWVRIVKGSTKRTA